MLISYNLCVTYEINVQVTMNCCVQSVIYYPVLNIRTQTASISLLYSMSVKVVLLQLVPMHRI